MQQLTVSATLKVAAEADRLKREGHDIVDLGAGEPDFITPVHVREAAKAGIDAGYTKYTQNAGAPELKQAICDRYAVDYGIHYTPAEIIVTAGGKQALFNVAQAAFGAGDEVVTHAPGWPTIVEQIKLAGAAPVVVRAHAEDGFGLTAQLFVDAITPRTRGFVINAPGNPTGALMPEHELAALADVAAERDLWIVLDLCYEKLVYDAVPALPRVLFERLKDRAALCGSTSKAYAMTGWRCGWVAGPQALVSACNTVQSHTTSNVCSITQKAALAALTGPQQCVTDMLDEYRVRRDRIAEWMSADPRIRCFTPAGAFYLFPDVSDLLSMDGIRTSAELAERLLREAQVALTAGEAFDAPGFLRLSYAASLDRLREGADRILRFAAAIRT
jgi:aspartate aminotransferase